MTISEILKALRIDDADKLSEWPPDLFAITSILLETSGAYRLVVSPSPGKTWPPNGWKDSVKTLAEEWRTALNSAERAPSGISDLISTAFRPDTTDSSVLVQLSGESRAIAVLTLHAVCDQVCSGVGISVTGPFALKASYRLAEAGTLARFDPSVGRVLPKLRTPQVGITIRSLSHFLAFSRSEVGVRWAKCSSGAGPDDRLLNVLLVPWPYTVGPKDFFPRGGPLVEMDERHFGFYGFEPKQKFTKEPLTELIVACKKQCAHLDAVVFPECALTPEEVVEVEGCLATHEVPILIAGVRVTKSTKDLNENYAQLSMRVNEKWESYQQPKHHRWCIDGTQIRNYNVASALDPRKKWWEAIDIPPREVTFVVADERITICPLICEDLARLDPVSSLIRIVGPTLIAAVLLDGPQLDGRWPGRYASVLADDPGSSVLTLTSLGMALRSRPPGKEPSPVVALWKDARTGVHEVSLEKDALGIMLTLAIESADEWTADGRHDAQDAALLVLRSINQVPARENRAWA